MQNEGYCLFNLLDCYSLGKVDYYAYSISLSVVIGEHCHCP